MASPTERIASNGDHDADRPSERIRKASVQSEFGKATLKRFSHETKATYLVSVICSDKVSE